MGWRCAAGRRTYCAPLLLFMVLFPRYPKRGAKSFRVARDLTPADFEYVAQTGDDVEQLKLTCAVLSGILWWKTQWVRVGFLPAIIAPSSSWLSGDKRGSSSASAAVPAEPAATPWARSAARFNVRPCDE